MEELISDTNFNMKRLITLLFFVLTKLCLFAQANLVPNPSFEDLYSGFVCGDGATPRNYVDYWNHVYYWCMPNPYGFCPSSIDMSPATADLMCKSVSSDNSNPLGIHNGDHAVQLRCDPQTSGWVEYVVVKLDQPLPSDHFFYYEFYYKILSNQGLSHDKIGGHFFENKPSQCSAGPAPVGKLNSENISPEIYSKLPKPDGEWIRAFGYFDTKGKSKLQWAAFGSFDFDNDVSLTRLFLDDIRVIDVGADHCPERWLFDNITFNQGLEIYQASNQITIGNGADPQVLDGAVAVKSGSELFLTAGNIITFLPGTLIESGAKVVAKIEGCKSNPCAVPTYKNFQPQPCGTPVVLDVFNFTNPGVWKVTWSPAKYVSDPSSVKPTFIPPAGSGSIVMSVSVTDLCGNTYYQSFPIPYNDHPIQTPSLIITNKQENKYDLSFDVSVAGSPADVQIMISGTSYNFTKTIVPGNLYHWTSSNGELNSCGVYTVTIKSTNKCSGQSTSQSMVWDRKSNLTFSSLTNVLNVNSSINSKLYAYCQGADYYETKIFNRAGIQIETESGKVLTSPAPVFTAKGNYSDGTYYYTVKLSNCSAQSEIKGQYFTWFNSKTVQSVSAKMEIVDSTSLSSKMTTLSHDIALDEKAIERLIEIKFSPNPNNGVIKLFIGSNEVEQAFTVLVSDVEGKQLYKRNVDVNAEKTFDIDIREFNQGVYILKVFNDKTSYTERLVKF